LESFDKTLAVWDIMLYNRNMKNMYLYGASDDLCEMESDFGIEEEFVGDALFNEQLKFRWRYDGDWHIDAFGTIPDGWKVRKISGTSDFIHIQIPEDQVVQYLDLGLDE
jgi:hypothetical protein